MSRFVVLFVVAMSIGVSSGCHHGRPHNIPVGLEDFVYGLHCMRGGRIHRPYSCQPCPYYDYRRDRWKNSVHGCCHQTIVSETEVVVDQVAPAPDAVEPAEGD